MSKVAPPSAPSPGSSQARKAFLAGLVCGAVVLLGLRVLVNETPAADWLVAPLLMPDNATSGDAIVAVGAGVVGTCEPNLNSLRRVLLGARLLREGRASFVLFTGGSAQRTCPVASAMAALALEIGIPASRIRVEQASHSTHENAEFSAPMLAGWGVHRVILVTDRLHMRRAAGAFERHGFAVQRASVPIYEGHEDNVSMLRAGLREYAALAQYWAWGWTGDAALTSLARKEAPHYMATTPKHPNGPIVLLGASYAQGWDLHQVGSLPVVNRGIAGQQSFEFAQRFERDVVAEAPRAVIIWGFVNDLFRATNDSDDVQVRIRESYLQMVAVARSHGIEPILATEVTIRPTGGWLTRTLGSVVGVLRGKASYQDQINGHVMATNEWLIAWAQRERLLVLQLQAVLSEPGGRRRAPFAQPDGSHITQAGYDALTAYALPILQEYSVAP